MRMQREDERWRDCYRRSTWRSLLDCFRRAMRCKPSGSRPPSPRPVRRTAHRWASLLTSTWLPASIRTRGACFAREAKLVSPQAGALKAPLARLDDAPLRAVRKTGRTRSNVHLLGAASRASIRLRSRRPGSGRGRAQESRGSDQRREPGELWRRFCIPDRGGSVWHGGNCWSVGGRYRQSVRHLPPDAGGHTRPPLTVVKDVSAVWRRDAAATGEGGIHNAWRWEL